MTHPDQTVRGPYSASFGAIHHEDQPGFLFTITPASAAPEVARALNIAAAPSPEAEGAGELADDIATLADLAVWFERSERPSTIQLPRIARSIKRVLAALQRPQTTAHPCYGEHQPGCDCVTPPQPEQVKPSYLDRLAQTTAPDSGLVEALGDATSALASITGLAQSATNACVEALAQARKGAA